MRDKLAGSRVCSRTQYQASALSKDGGGCPVQAPSMKSAPVHPSFTQAMRAVIHAPSEAGIVEASLESDRKMMDAAKKMVVCWEAAKVTRENKKEIAPAALGSDKGNDSGSDADDEGPVELKHLGSLPLRLDPETGRYRFDPQMPRTFGVDLTKWCKEPSRLSAGSTRRDCRDCTRRVSAELDRGFGFDPIQDHDGIWHMSVQGQWKDGPLCVRLSPLPAVAQ